MTDGRGRDFLADAVRRRPGATALSDGVRSWRWAELSDRSIELAAELPHGTGGQVCIATLYDPGPAGVVALHAVLRSGGLLAPLNPALGREGLVGALRALRPAVVLTDMARREAVEGLVGEEGLETEVRGMPSDLRRGVDGRDVAGAGSSGRIVDAGGADSDRAVVGPDRPVAVLWTSGTSGRPRGVLLSAAALRHSARASAQRLALGPDDRWYASLSPAHVGGLALVTRAALLGSTLVATGPFDAEHLSALIDWGEVTHASLVPTMLLRLLEARDDRPVPRTFRCALVGGAHCPHPLLDRALSAGVPVALTYGMTEATSQVATAPPALVRRKAGTAGTPLEGVELRITPDGEIQVRGATLALGLLESAAERASGARGPSAARPQGDPAPRTGPSGPPPAVAWGMETRAVALVDHDGWYATGDLGEIDEEGHLWVTGRRSLRIISGGVNVDPAEVEEVLLRHAAVAEACVVGLPDPEWGQRVVAAVVPADGGAETDAAALRAWCRGRLGGPRTPKAVAILPALPRNANGKLDRRAIQATLGALMTRPPE